MDDFLEEVFAELFGLVWIVNVSFQIIEEVGSFWVLFIHGFVGVLECGSEVSVGTTPQGQPDYRVADDPVSFCEDEEGHPVAHTFTDPNERPNELSGVLWEGWVTHLVENRFVEDELEEHGDVQCVAKQPLSWGSPIQGSCRQGGSEAQK